MADRDWALGAAKQDATYLISPTARQRAIVILKNDKSSLADAARVILLDGMAQQTGLTTQTASMDVWREAAESLGVFDDV